MAAAMVAPAAMVATPAAPEAVADRTPPSPEYVFDDAEDDGLPHRTRTHDAPFWVGVTMGVTGLGVIIFAATEMLAAHG